MCCQDSFARLASVCLGLRLALVVAHAGSEAPGAAPVSVSTTGGTATDEFALARARKSSFAASVQRRSAVRAQELQVSLQFHGLACLLAGLHLLQPDPLA